MYSKAYGFKEPWTIGIRMHEDRKLITLHVKHMQTMLESHAKRFWELTQGYPSPHHQQPLQH